MTEQSKVWLNGKLIPWWEATVPILSHGFSRASAILEVFGTYVGPQGTMTFRMDEHLKRLMKSAEQPGAGPGQFKTRIRVYLQVAQNPSGNSTGCSKVLFQLFECLSGPQGCREPWL